MTGQGDDGGQVSRFAPSPTGLLHLGHAYSALLAADRARGGRFLLRIEDIDRARCRPEFEAAIFVDLRWLGLNWPQPVMRQSARLGVYGAALARLGKMGVLYPCRCRRGDIRAALSAPQEGATAVGPDGPVYPGTCRGRALGRTEPQDAVRLDLGRALDLVGAVAFTETAEGLAGEHRLDRDWMQAHVGDVVLARRDLGTSYHLSVVVDDAAQGITEVVRGADLFDATFIHVVLQRLLGLPVPGYHHHRLIRDESGKRLAKRDNSRALAAYRASGAQPDDIRAMLSQAGG